MEATDGRIDNPGEEQTSVHTVSAETTESVMTMLASVWKCRVQKIEKLTVKGNNMEKEHGFLRWEVAQPKYKLREFEDERDRTIWTLEEHSSGSGRKKRKNELILELSRIMEGKTGSENSAAFHIANQGKDEQTRPTSSTRTAAFKSGILRYTIWETKQGRKHQINLLTNMWNCSKTTTGKNIKIPLILDTKLCENSIRTEKNGTVIQQSQRRSTWGNLQSAGGVLGDMVTAWAGLRLELDFGSYDLW